MGGMEIFLIALLIGVVAGTIWFVVWAMAGGARKQGARVMERAEARRASKEG
jgi:hypothetical protein